MTKTMKHTILEEGKIFLLNDALAVVISDIKEGSQSTDFVMTQTDENGLDWSASCSWFNDDINEELKLHPEENQT